MLYFKDKTNGVHCLDSEIFAYLLPEGSVEITQAEADALRAPPPPTIAEIIATYTAAIQKRLDDFARTSNYDGILSAATYATSTVPKFNVEGQYAVEARDETWARFYEVLAAVEAGSRPIPTMDELLAELPILGWPDEAMK